MRKKFNLMVASFDAMLQKIPGFGKSEPQSVRTVNSDTMVTPPYKAPTKSLFQKTFRSEERLKLEAYNKASTQAEQDAILATMKPTMA